MLLRFRLLTVAEPQERAVTASSTKRMEVAPRAPPSCRRGRRAHRQRRAGGVGSPGCARARSLSYCRRRCPGYDLGDGRRRWWGLDFGTTFAYLEADAPRVSCKRHGVIVAAVPWARHDSVFTRQFEDQVAWLTVQASKTAVSQLMRVAWRTVGWICTRVTEEATQARDLFTGLKRIGVDEISIRKRQRYLTVVVDHDTGRLVWAGPGRDRKTVEKFLDLLGKERCHQIKLISCAWPCGSLARRRALPERERLLRPVHLIKLSTDALDEIRREVWNDARRQGQTQLAKELKGARFALWKNPGNLTERQQLELARVQQLNQRLYRAYLLSNNSARSTGYRSIKRSRCSTPGSHGRDKPTGTVRRTRAHHHRTAFRDRSRDSQPAVERPSRAGEHPARLITAARSGSTPLTPRSRSRCSPSAGSAHHYQAADTTHGSCRRSRKKPTRETKVKSLSTKSATERI